MKEKLTQYVNLLFAGNQDAEEIRQEILQNTLDRYDDLIDQGKSPEAAYSLAISGIGDVSEILNGERFETTAAPLSDNEQPISRSNTTQAKKRKTMQAVAIAFYICSVIPVIALGDIGNGIIGVCLMFLLIAAATALLIMAGNNEEKKNADEPSKNKKRSVSGTITLVVYLVVSFVTGDWWITWLIFPISGAIDGLIRAINDLKEEIKK